MQVGYDDVTSKFAAIVSIQLASIELAARLVEGSLSMAPIGNLTKIVFLAKIFMVALF